MTDNRSLEEIVGDTYDAVPTEYDGIPLDGVVRQMAEELQALRKLRDDLKVELRVRRAEAARVVEILGRRYAGWGMPETIQALLASQDSSRELSDYYAGALALIPKDMRHLTLKEVVEQLEPLTKQVEILQAALADSRIEAAKDAEVAREYKEARNILPPELRGMNLRAAIEKLLDNPAKPKPHTHSGHWQEEDGTDKYELVLPLGRDDRRLRLTLSVVDGQDAQVSLRVNGPTSSDFVGTITDVSLEAAEALVRPLADLKTDTRLEAR